MRHARPDKFFDRLGQEQIMDFPRRNFAAALALAPAALAVTASGPANAQTGQAQRNGTTNVALPTSARLNATNTIIVMVDYMSKLIDGVKSHPRGVVINNATAYGKIGAIFELPTFILGDEGERLGVYDPIIHAPVSMGVKVPRHTVSGWREPPFVRAVRATGRRNLVLAGISTDMCVSLLAMDALAAGYSIYLVVDASSSQSAEMHRAGVDRLVQAGVIPMTWVSLSAELLGDWQSPKAPQMAALYAQHLGLS
jgi:Isochorismatase family